MPNQNATNSTDKQSYLFLLSNYIYSKNAHRIFTYQNDLVFLSGKHCLIIAIPPF